MVHIIYITIILYTIFCHKFLYELYDLDSFESGTLKCVLFIFVAYFYTPIIVIPLFIINELLDFFHLRVWFRIYFTKRFRNLNDDLKKDMIKRLESIKNNPSKNSSFKRWMYKRTIMKVCRMNNIDYTKYN